MEGACIHLKMTISLKIDENEHFERTRNLKNQKTRKSEGHEIRLPEHQKVSRSANQELGNRKEVRATVGTIGEIYIYIINYSKFNLIGYFNFLIE